MEEKELKEWRLEKNLQIREAQKRGEITRFEANRQLKEITNHPSL